MKFFWRFVGTIRYALATSFGWLRWHTWDALVEWDTIRRFR